MNPGETWVPEINSERKHLHVDALISDALTAHDLLEISEQLYKALDEILPLVDHAVFQVPPHIQNCYNALDKFEKCRDALINKEDIQQVERVILGEVSRTEEFAYLALAILTKLDCGTTFTDHSIELLGRIRGSDDEGTKFKQRLGELVKPNKFGITELSKEDVSRVLAFVFGCSEC